MIPDSITINFCYDNVNLPAQNNPVLCIFPSHLGLTGQPVVLYEYCTLLQNLENPLDTFWVKHNSLDKVRVHPYAWFDMPNGLPDPAFMTALAKLKQLTFSLQPF